jgi:FAD/FMN-containing dehydrogenase
MPGADVGKGGGGMNVQVMDKLKDVLYEGELKTQKSALADYFKDPPTDIKLTLAMPRDVEELGAMADVAYENDIPIYTYRRGYLPQELASSEGILFDLKMMDKIVRIDDTNLIAFIEYGVTFERLKEELDKLDLRLLMPAAATSSSIVRSYIDRDIILANGATRPYQFTTFHAILGDGRLWMSGTDQYTPDGHSEFREDLGPMYSNLFHASEDIFGMPYAMKAWIYRRWEERRVSTYGFDDAESALRAARLACRHDQVFECVAADSTYLSVLLSGSPDEADAMARELSPWNVVFGFDNHSKLVDVWDRQTSEMAADCGGKKASEELSKRMQERFEWPWYISERDHYRGDTTIIDYYTLIGKVAGMFADTAEMAKKYDIGQVVIPMYYGAAFYAETDLYHAKDDPEVHQVWVDIYKTLLDKGAHLNRPSDEVAEVVYGRMNDENIRMIKDLKKVLDPKGLLNPDQLMEGV